MSPLPPPEPVETVILRDFRAFLGRSGSLRDLQRRCAEETLPHLSEYAVLGRPSPPSDYREYLSIKPDLSQASDEVKRRATERWGGYWQAVRHATVENQTRADWLAACLVWLGEEHPAAARLIGRLGDFARAGITPDSPWLKTATR